MLDVPPLSSVLTSMPGIGIRTAARILLEVGDGSSFPTAEHRAAYAGLAAVTRRSGTCIRSEHAGKGAFFLSAFAARPTRSSGPTTTGNALKTRTNAAVICLAPPA